MERSRATTAKRGRRHDALRRSLRRQGVFAHQEGGARNAGWTLFPAGIPLVSAAKDFLKEALAGTDFAFLTADGPDWRTGEDASKKYAQLIMRQDELLSLGLEKIRAALTITETTTDGELVTAVNGLTPEDLRKYIKALELLGQAVIQSPTNVGAGLDPAATPVTQTGPTVSKLQYNLSPSTGVTLQMRLIYMLLYPSLMTNVTVRGIAEVLKRLKDEKETTLPLIQSKDAMIHSILSDKYTWYLRSNAATYTNDQLRDSICLWAKSSTGEKAWGNFFKRFLLHLTEPDVTDNGGVLAKLGALTSGNELVTLARKVSTEEYNTTKETTDDTTDMKICSFIAAVVFSSFKGGATTKKEFLTPFLSVKDLPESLPADMPGGEKRNYAVAASKDQLTGMLPSSVWGQSLLDETGAESVTFQSLLNTLSPRYIHYLLHLVSVLQTDSTV